MSIKKLTLSIFALFLSLIVFAQSVDKNSSMKELNEFYNQHIGDAAILYSGPSYVPQTYAREGSPFFASDTLSLGWISYDGHLYKDVLLQWDVLQNYIITQSLMENVKLILRNELIDSFYFSGHLVKFLPTDKKNNFMQAGLYDILYAGPTSFIAKRKKTYDRNMENKTVMDIYDKNTFFYQKEWPVSSCK